MPEITRFYGIVLKMFTKPKENNTPHVYAIYDECLGFFNLKTLQMTYGDLPNKAQQLVLEWFQIHQKELIQMWNTQKIYKLPPLR